MLVVTDITELKTGGGKLHLCIVLDLFDQRVVGWSTHHRQDRQMVIRAVQMAVWQRQDTGPVILHSDRGSQFRSGDYQRYLAANGLVCSMSAVGHCGDNAACEGFFGMLKRERVYRTKYPTLDAARTDVFEIHRAVPQPEDAAKSRQARPEVLSPFTTVRDFGVEPNSPLTVRGLGNAPRAERASAARSSAVSAASKGLASRALETACSRRNGSAAWLCKATPQVPAKARTGK